MVNKKGFIRIVEAIIAVVVIFGFILIAFPQGKEQSAGETPYEIEQTQARIVEEITNNVEYRRCILNLSGGSPGCVDTLIKPHVAESSAMSYSFEITNTSSTLVSAKNRPLDKDVYAKTVVVSVDDVLIANAITDSQKRYYKFTLYLWYNI